MVYDLFVRMRELKNINNKKDNKEIDDNLNIKIFFCCNILIILQE